MTCSRMSSYSKDPVLDKDTGLVPVMHARGSGFATLASWSM